MIGGKLVLITNRKSYMSFRLVPKSLTLYDLKRHNNGVKGVTMRYFTEFGSLQAHYVKVVEDTPILLHQKCSPKNVVFGDIATRRTIVCSHNPLPPRAQQTDLSYVGINKLFYLLRYSPWLPRTSALCIWQSHTSITYSLLFSNSICTCTMSS